MTDSHEHNDERKDPGKPEAGKPKEPRERIDAPKAGAKAPRGDAAPKGERGPKPARDAQVPKGEAGAKAPKEAAQAPKERKEGPKDRKEAAKREGATADAAPIVRTVPVRLRERYRKEVVPRLRERFRYRNVMEVPRLEKVVVNVRVGDATTDTRFVDKAVEELTQIAGQRPAVARARVSIAAFKLRRGMPIATRVTLRGDRMYEFVDKLFSVTLPRIKDFKGIGERQFDGRGNLNIGVREQLIFPEIEYDKVEKIRGMDITLVTTAKTDEEARELLKALGLPLREAGAPGEAAAAR
jgi:large subunit ribosomal protein L5